MKTFDYPLTEGCPSISLNYKEGILMISGRSILPDSDIVYKPIMDLLDNYFDQNDKIVCNFQLEYFNSCSARSLMQLFQVLEKHAMKGKYVTSIWYFEEDDDDSYEFGLGLQKSLQYSVELIEIQNKKSV